MSSLPQRIQELAQTPVLLVATDFDGVLAPLVDVPGDVKLNADCWAALHALHALPHTHAALVSGRARADLLSHLIGPVAPGFTVIGSHGAERSDTPIVLSPAQRVHLDQATLLLHPYAANLEGAIIEPKPASVCFHYRRCDPVRAVETVALIRHQLAALPGITTLDGDMILEAFVHPPGKDAAVEYIRHLRGASAVIFLGDDTTDEMVFAKLSAHDLAVKVGLQPTVAPFRIPDQTAVAPLLRELADHRRRFLAERTLTPIQRHAILSDQRAIALVDPSGSIVWSCLPRIDSAPIFAHLLGGPSRGHFSVVPVDPPADPPVQSYLGDTFTLRTAYPGDALAITDYLDCTAGRAFQRAGRSELVRVIENAAPVRVSFAPRLDFGRVPTHIRVHENGLEVDGWPDPIVLLSPGVDWTITRESTGGHDTAVAILQPSPVPRTLELRYGTASLLPGSLPEPVRSEQSRRFWSGWSSTLKLPDLHRDFIRRSALVLKALTYGPTGAISAAATTSLPEHLGGSRNWDYRYCWPRDACMSAAALTRLGNTGAAIKLLDWLVGVVERTDTPERLRPIYTVGGSHLGLEAEIAELPGYGGSRPVRIGNAASHQVQLDVFGPIVDLVALLAEAGAPVTPEQWKLVQQMVAAVEMRWQEPDHGIWEIRGPKLHHIHTKAMCFHAVNRAQVVAKTAMGVDRPGWRTLADSIARDLLANGWSETLGAFGSSYGSDHPDAATLWVGLAGVLPPDDQRFIRTVDVVQRLLRRGPVVDRYAHDDGLPGREGAWVICACWLVECLALIGREKEAHDLLDQVISLAGPTNLLAEEYEPDYAIALGNFPQAYSHLGVINATLRLAR